MKNERGITLISLTIAIVVIFILSGVVIYSSLNDNNGIINGIKDETIEQQNKVQKEKDKMNSVLQDVEEEWGIG